MRPLSRDIYSSTHRDVDLALQSLEFEDERQEEALRKFYLREREATVVPRRTLLQWAALTALVGALWGFGIVWVYPFLHRVMARLF